MASIPGTIPVTSGIAPTDTTDTFATHIDIYGEGGYMTVADQAEREAITTERRKQGMAVYQNDTNEMYVLKDGVTNSDWVVFSGGTGGSIDITDGTTTVAGASDLNLDDENFVVTAGTPSTVAEVNTAYNTSIDPATSVAINVNDLNNLTAADFVGLSTTEVLNKLLFPTLQPSYAPGPATSLVNSQTATVEIGSQVTSNLSLSLIKNNSGGLDTGTPATITSSVGGSLTLSGPTTTPEQNLQDQFGYANANNPNEKDTYTVTEVVTMPASGSINYTSSISWLQGNQLKDSTGVDSGTPIAAGTGNPTNSVSGIYPYFWGLIPVASLTQVYATAIQEVVTEIQNGNATKVVEGSGNNISVPFNATAGVNFMFFATPATSTTKTVWFENALNTGAIAGTDFADPNRKLFSSPSTQAITTVLWSNVNYKVYVALKSSDATTIQLKNN